MGSPITQAYCYDTADRLTSKVTTGAPAESNPVNQTLLAADIVYDARGNTTTLADQTNRFDSTDRATGISTTAGTTIGYAKDALGRTDSRTEGANTIKFGFGGASVIMDNAGAVIQYTYSLPGGVTLSKRPSDSSELATPRVTGTIHMRLPLVGTVLGRPRNMPRVGERMGRTLGTLTCMTVVALLLTSCDLRNNQTGPISLRVSANDLAVAICTDIRASELSVEQSIGNESTEIWRASGDVNIRRGDQITSKTISDFFSTASADRMAGDADGIYVLLKSAGRPDDVIAAFDTSHLGTEMWLHPDGRQTTNPCP